MADTTRPVDTKIIEAVQRMKRIQDAAKGLRETSQPEPTTPKTIERQPSSR